MLATRTQILATVYKTVAAFPEIPDQPLTEMDPSTQMLTMRELD